MALPLWRCRIKCIVRPGRCRVDACGVIGSVGCAEAARLRVVPINHSDSHC